MIEEYSGPCHSTVQHTTMAPLDSKLLCFTDLPCKSHLLRLLVYPKSPHPQSCYCEKASRNTCSIIQSESDMAKFQISCNYMSCQWMGCDCEELHCFFPLEVSRIMEEASNQPSHRTKPASYELHFPIPANGFSTSSNHSLRP
jgi:hypothetical protein